MGAIQYIGTGRLGASQDVAFGASSAASAAFGTQSYKVRLVATSDCRRRIGDGPPTAVATDTYLPALAAEYFTVTPGQKVAAIHVASAGTPVQSVVALAARLSSDDRRRFTRRRHPRIARRRPLRLA